MRQIKVEGMIADIERLSRSEQLLDSFIGDLRKAQQNYRNSLGQLYSWKDGEPKKVMEQATSNFFDDFSKHIQLLEERRYDILQTKKHLNRQIRAEINSGPKW